MELTMRAQTAQQHKGRLTALLVCGLCFAFATHARGATPPGKDALASATLIDEDRHERRGKMFATSGYYSMSSSKIQVSGVEFDAGYHYAQTDRFGFGPRVRQAFSVADGFATLFTGLVLDFTYAITGSLVSTDRVYKLGDFKAATIEEKDDGGIKAVVSISQFFINTTKVAVPFSGIGIGFKYDRPIGKNYSMTVGLSADRVTNTEVMIVPVQVYAGFVNSL